MNKPKKKVVVNKKDKLISMKIYKPKVKKKTAFQVAFENAVSSYQSINFFNLFQRGGIG